MYPTPYHSHLKKLTFSCLPGGKCTVFVLLKGERGGGNMGTFVFFEILPSLREQSNDIKENSARDMHKNVETWGWW